MDWKDVPWDAILTAVPWASIVTATSTLCAIWLTANVATRRSVREKVWDLKREAFGIVIDGLRETEFYAGQALKSLIAGEVARHDELMIKWRDHADTVRRRIARDRIILPDDFLQLYDEYACEMREIEASLHTKTERLVAAMALWRKYRPSLLRLAKADLQRGCRFR